MRGGGLYAPGASPSEDMMKSWASSDIAGCIGPGCSSSELGELFESCMRNALGGEMNEFL